MVKYMDMKYEAKNYDSLLGAPGFSDEILKNHFSLYQGYVNNVNKFDARINELIKNGQSVMTEYSELKRRFGWEWNGMRLHELYFENMIIDGKEINTGSALCRKIADNFGSFDSFKIDFKNTGLMRGIGWVILYYDIKNDKLFNAWINEHDTGHLSECAPLLVMDVFEHAYLTDYGIKKANYIEVFMKAINWRAAEKRLDENL